MSDHHCHAEGCSVVVAPRYFACVRHWRMVPLWLQDEIYRVYRPGQENDKQVTLRYVVVQTRCRLAIAMREKKEVGIVDRLKRELREWMRRGPEKIRGFVNDPDVTDDMVVELFDRMVRDPVKNLPA